MVAVRVAGGTLFGRVGVRESMVLRVGYSGTDFTDNDVRQVCEERLNLAVERPAAICWIKNLPTAAPTAAKAAAVELRRRNWCPAAESVRRHGFSLQSSPCRRLLSQQRPGDYRAVVARSDQRSPLPPRHGPPRPTPRSGSIPGAFAHHGSTLLTL